MAGRPAPSKSRLPPNDGTPSTSNARRFEKTRPPGDFCRKYGTTTSSLRRKQVKTGHRRSSGDRPPAASGLTAPSHHRPPPPTCRSLLLDVSPARETTASPFRRNRAPRQLPRRSSVDRAAKAAVDTWGPSGRRLRSILGGRSLNSVIIRGAGRVRYRGVQVVRHAVAASSSGDIPSPL